MRRKFLNKLVKEARKDINISFSTKLKSGGSFSHYPNRKCKIIINSNTTITYQVLALLHELGHFKCYKEKCVCYRHNTLTLREQHAFEHTIREAIKIGNKQLIEEVVQLIEYVCNNTDQYGPHGRACVRIKVSKIYEQLQALL